MVRERKGGGGGRTATSGRGALRGSPPNGPARRERRRAGDQSELDLTDEELRALADEGIDPDEVRRLARERRESEASDHDRDTARDELEGLVGETEEDY
jgi:hypothetical protein